ncbi:hypothetical protein HQ529_05050 [Candidatus Woesearchaeota archaeon]|nr:hypothetical protein [Candidatus Woesearchaeota archaeon]
MQKLKILNSKEVKEILSILKKQFGFESKLDYVFLMNEKNKIYIANKEVFDINIDNLNINSIGIYFAFMKNKQIRLSIEGSQIIGPVSKKNIVELHDNEAKLWMKGFDLFKTTKNKGFVLIKNNNDFLGCGKQIEDKILNYVPKIRRLKVSD